MKVQDMEKNINQFYCRSATNYGIERLLYVTVVTLQGNGCGSAVATKTRVKFSLCLSVESKRQK